MKTKTRYTLGLAALMLALAACTELTEPGELSGELIPKGMGQAHIRLDHVNARTAIPGLKALDFTLVFTQGTDSKTESLKDGLTTLTVVLKSGDWELTVEGYSSAKRLTVEGTTIVHVIEGISSNAVVDLKPVFTGGGTGTLDYNSVIFPPTVKQAFLTMNAPGTSEKIDLLKIDEDEPAPGTRALPAGSYQALIDLYDNTNNQAAVWTGIVHIYDGSTTFLAKEFEPANFAGPRVVGEGKTTLAAKLDEALDSPRGAYTIVLDGSETDLGSFTPKTLAVTDGKVIAITIEGNGQTVQVNTTGTPLFTLKTCLRLAIQDLTLKGRTSNSVPVVRVESQGTLEMKTGSLITGNTSSTGGGGVTVVSGGTLNISGGAISGNSSTLSDNGGGGVFVTNGGKFTMSSGAVSDNSGPNGGGVFVSTGGEFTMSGGVLSSNQAGGQGGGVFVYGTFSMSGGVLSGNKTNHGGGVYNRGTFTMSGGTISGNTSQQGGGVFVNVHSGSPGKFSMSGGVIYGSEAENGTKANKATEGKSAAIYNSGGTVSAGELVMEAAWDETIDMGQLIP